jgi:hypothetical protein
VNAGFASSACGCDSAFGGGAAGTEGGMSDHGGQGGISIQMYRECSDYPARPPQACASPLEPPACLLPSALLSRA